VDHHITIDEQGEGGVQAVCSCGWRSPVFGTGKTDGTMDPLQRATRCWRPAPVGDVPAISSSATPPALIAQRCCQVRADQLSELGASST
jgi:hypothetical protein